MWFWNALVLLWIDSCINTGHLESRCVRFFFGSRPVNLPEFSPHRFAFDTRRLAITWLDFFFGIPYASSVYAVFLRYAIYINNSPFLSLQFHHSPLALSPALNVLSKKMPIRKNTTPSFVSPSDSNIASPDICIFHPIQQSSGYCSATLLRACQTQGQISVAQL